MILLIQEELSNPLQRKIKSTNLYNFAEAEAGKTIWE